MHKLMATAIVYTSKLASRRCIIAYIVLDMSLCIAFVTFYTLFAAAGYTCRFTPTWLLNCYWILRSLLMVFGIFAVAIRKVAFVRLFWFFWIGFNVVGLGNLVPLTLTTCSCDNYFQCWLLASFTPHRTSGVKFTNPFFPPPAALSCDGPGQCATPKGLLPFTYSSPPKLEHEMDLYTDQGFLEVHRQLTHHKKGARFHGQDLHMGPTSNQGHKVSDLVKSFRLTPGICWEGTYKQTKTLTVALSKDMVEVLSCMFHQNQACRTLKSDNWAKLLENLAFVFDSCLSRPLCSVVQMSIGDSFTNLHSFYYTVDPVPASNCNGGQILSLQKVREAGKPSRPQKVVHEFNRMRYYLSFKELTDMLVSDYDTGCKCSESLSPSGCTFYHDNGKPSFWCYVSEDSVDSCKRRGYILHRDGDNFWTHDICNQEPDKACACSGSGVPPPFDSWDRIPDKQMLDGPHGDWKYGSFCAPWDKDQPSWCFVGFDTSCPDRTRVKWRPGGTGTKRSINMDVSYLACSRQKVQEIMDKVGMSRCRLTISIAIAVVVLWFFVGILMQDVAFEFMKNGCGDQVADLSSSGQYPVEDWSDDEDEWTVKGPPDMFPGHRT